ncbi:MAG: hypothetical protein ACFE0R_12780 [Salinarimonas sp.]
MRSTKRTSPAKPAAQGRRAERRTSPQGWSGPELGDAFWSGSDPAVGEAVFDVVFDEDVVEPRPGEAPEAWRTRVEAAVRTRAADLRSQDDVDADPPGSSR